MLNVKHAVLYPLQNLFVCNNALSVEFKAGSGIHIMLDYDYDYERWMKRPNDHHALLQISTEIFFGLVKSSLSQ